jgi:Mn-containing catalase
VQLELFKSSNDDTVRLKFLLSDFIKDGNNYAQFKKAINQLRSVRDWDKISFTSMLE